MISDKERKQITGRYAAIKAKIKRIVDKYDGTVEQQSILIENHYRFNPYFAKNEDGKTLAIIHYVAPKASGNLLSTQIDYQQTLISLIKEHHIDKAYETRDGINFEVIKKTEPSEPFDTSFFPKSININSEILYKELSSLFSSQYEKDLEWKDVKDNILKNIPQKLSSLPIYKFINTGIPEQEKVHIKGDLMFFPQNYQTDFFMNLLNAKVVDKVCRYTNIPSIFRTLSSGVQSMCSLVCMNDPSECSYALKKLGVLNEENVISDANNYYILSLTDKDKYDDLTMYRLYGDDGKGVCLYYKVITDRLEDKFYLAPISYGGKRSHPELTFLKGLLTKVYKDRGFQFDNLSAWLHFFKPYEYAVEKEIRLLAKVPLNDVYSKSPKYTLGKGIWIHDSSSNVATPIMLYPVTNGNSKFPLTLEHIVIGPKSASSDFNLKQLEILSKSMDIEIDTNGKPLCSKSGITVYR